MKPKQNFLTPCIIRVVVDDRMSPNANTAHRDSVVVRSIRKMIPSDLSSDDIGKPCLNQPVTSRNTHIGAVDAAILIVADQIQNVELEIEMLNLRKRALKRRSRILDKMSQSMHSQDDEKIA